MRDDLVMDTPPHVSQSAGSQPIGLLGDAHLQLLADLVDRFERVSAGDTSVARVVLLRGASGAGKSRIVRELYRHLREVQPEPGYWPALPEDDAVRSTGAGVDPLPNRKVLGPEPEEFLWHAGALPSFTWWAFDCGRMRSGGLVEAVDQARPALQVHLLPAMQAKAAQLGVEEKTLRLFDLARERIREAAEEGALEGLNWVASELAGTAVPGLGLAVDWVTRGVRAAHRGVEERQLLVTEVSFAGRAGQAHRTLAAEFAELVLATVHPEVPAVVVVEDVHLMGEGLVEFLRLVSARADARPVLVIATAWPEGEHPTFIQWRTHTRNTGNLEEWVMPNLGMEDRVSLLRRVAPATRAEDARRVAARYPNPLALKLFLSDDWVVPEIHQGALDLESLDLETVPTDVKDLYARRIAELPEQVRKALECAASALPLTWPTGPYRPEVVAVAAAKVIAVERESVVAGLVRAVEKDVTLSSRGLHSFREALIAEVLAERVRKKARVQLQEATRQALREHIAVVRGDRYLFQKPSRVDIHAAFWLTELLDRRPKTVDDAIAFTLTARTLIYSYQYRLVAELLQEALHHLPPDHPDTIVARSDLATAYQFMGVPAKAIPLYEALIADAPRVNTADHSQTLTARNNLAAAYREVGDLAKAIPLAKEVMKEAKKELGPDSEFTLGTRNGLGAAYRASGDLKRAAKQYKRAVRDSRQALGEDHAQTLMSRHNLAFVHLERGDRDRAIRQYKKVVEGCRRALGEDHPQTLRSRHNLAGAYVDNGELTLAIGQLESVMRDSRRLLSDHPQTLRSRKLLAEMYEKAGDLTQATLEFEAVVHDFRRVWGQGDFRTLGVLHQLARAYFNNHEVGRAIPVFETLVDGYAVTVGPDHPDALTAQTDLACAYYEVSDGRAVPLLEGVLSDRERTLGRGHPHTLRSRDILANAYFNAGLRERAVLMLRENLRYASGRPDSTNSP